MTLQYPLSETQADLRGATGRPLAEMTLDAVRDGTLSMADFGISPEALQAQARIAEEADRRPLAENLRRAAEMVAIPDAEIFAIYDLLRPGRAVDLGALRAAADRLEDAFDAPRLADFVREAADAYAARDLNKLRY